MSSAAVVIGALRDNSLTTKKQTTKFLSAYFQKMVKSNLYHIERANSVDLDEVAHNSHLIKIYAVCK